MSIKPNIEREKIELTIERNIEQALYIDMRENHPTSYDELDLINKNIIILNYKIFDLNNELNNIIAIGWLLLSLSLTGLFVLIFKKQSWFLKYSK